MEREIGRAVAFGYEPARKATLLRHDGPLHAWCLLLDEPTNHLDLPAIERLEAALAAFPGALVVVTHDDAFGDAVAKRVWTLREGTLSEE